MATPLTLRKTPAATRLTLSKGQTMAELQPGQQVSCELYGGTLEGFIMWRVDGMVTYGNRPFYRVRVTAVHGNRPEKRGDSVTLAETMLALP